MRDKNTGGPAFPSKGNEIARQQALALGLQYNEPSGMTLRDYFAAKAMQGLLTNGAMPFDTKGQTLKDFLARAAYDYADSMLEARK